MALPTLQTPRLTLRPYRLADTADLVRLAGTREVAAMTLRIPHPYTEHDAVEFITSCRADFDLGRSARFAIALRGSGEFCGGIGLRIMSEHRRAELGYWLGVPYWGKGYATEASQEILRFGFETLKLRRIYASYVTENPASGRVLEKIGMRYEGILRSHICKWDVFHDLVFYGILQNEFRARSS
jgi:[ribosomal protein S5]-alanine N-acetyltransferase